MRHHRAADLLGGEGALDIPVGVEHLGLGGQALAGGDQDDRGIAGHTVGAEEEIQVWVIGRMRKFEQDYVGGDTLDGLAQLAGQA